MLYAAPSDQSRSDVWERPWDVFHVGVVRLHEVLDACVPGTPHEFLQERLVGVDGVHATSELLCERDGLTTGPGTGIDDEAKPLLGEEAQDMQRVGVVAWPELFHAAEEQVDGVADVHT
jgi:hypothetical protein